jgi:hypothetical protein
VNKNTLSFTATRNPSKKERRPPHMHAHNRYAPVSRPNEVQINEYACVLAKEEGQTGREIFNLIRWPRHASPPCSEFAYVKWNYVQSLRQKARAILEEQMAALPRVRIKR